MPVPARTNTEDDEGESHDSAAEDSRRDEMSPQGLPVGVERCLDVAVCC